MIDRLDHLVLTVGDLDATIAFYEGVLGMRHETFEDGRSALRFGDAKINLHQVDRTVEPNAAAPTPGSADLCFVASIPLQEVQSRLAAARVPIERGPIARSGALGPIVSVYLRDPDGNLVEISTYA